MKLTNIIFTQILLLFIFSIFAIPNTIYANPSPLPDIYSDASISNTSTTPIYLKSENINITVDSDEIAYENVEYFLKNNSNNNYTQEVYLPFFAKPLKTDAYVNDKKIELNWTTVTIFSKPDQHGINELKLNSIHFKYEFKANEELKVKANYYRKIRSGLNEPLSHIEPKGLETLFGHGDWAENKYFYKCIYLSRTGSSWSKPIESAIFTFKINKQLLNNNKSFINDADHSSHDFSRGFKNFDYWSANNVYLTKISTEEDNFVTLSKNFTNWTPTYDVGVCWFVPRNERESLLLEKIVDYSYILIVIIIFISIIIVIVKTIKL